MGAERRRLSAALDSVRARAAIDLNPRNWALCCVFRPEHRAGRAVPSRFFRTIDPLGHQFSFDQEQFNKDASGPASGCLRRKPRWPYAWLHLGRLRATGVVRYVRGKEREISPTRGQVLNLLEAMLAKLAKSFTPSFLNGIE